MTNKEQIIIHGCNVLKCRYYQYKTLKDCEMRYPESGDCEIGLINYLFNGNLDMEKLCVDNPNCIFKQLARKTQECTSLKEELNFLKNNEDLLISNLQVLWGKQIAEEQGDCKNIDYSKPRTKEIYHKITEIDRTLKDVAFAQSINIGKTKPLGDTGSPKSYKRWEARERKLLEREFLK